MALLHLNRLRRRQRWRGVAALCGGLVVAGCGGGGSNPLGNPPLVANPASVGGQKLSFAYFQRCINPIFTAPLPINGGTSTVTCAGSGCHDDKNGTGGAFRVVPGATMVDVTNAANTPDVIKTLDIYKNFYSAQAMVVFGSPAQSRLLLKPRVQGVLHGGGLVFENAQDPKIKLIEFWITHPVPQGQDEFSSAVYTSLFTPPDPINGACNTQ
jgi:hypothetical protein